MKGIKISALAFITWCPQKEISGIWGIESFEKHRAAHAGQTLSRLKFSGVATRWLGSVQALLARRWEQWESKAELPQLREKWW